uniref:protein-histidine N-methyltransferase n=1 Tax=Plectus sambesii TaxID=2011161 RepID=A0A914VLD5_9BILA
MLSDEDKSKSLVLKSGEELFFAPSSAVEARLKKSGYENDLAIQSTNHSDLTAGVYEGGFKVWEGAIDLCNYLDSSVQAEEIAEKSVLELGCGAGLPGIYAAKKNAKFVSFQDFNQSVLDCFTRTNVQLNSVNLDRCRFVAGDWVDCLQSFEGQKYDIVLTAETIYSEASFTKLHDIIDRTLADDGIVLIAAKLYYFGVGGSVPAFMDFVKRQGRLNVQDVWTSDTAVPRKILKLTRIR